MRGGGFLGRILWLVMQPPYLSYALLLALFACVSFKMLDDRRVFGPVQLIGLGCMVPVFLLRDAEGYGVAYFAIWVFGAIGIGAYWLDKAIHSNASIW